MVHTGIDPVFGLSEILGLPYFHRPPCHPSNHPETFAHLPALPIPQLDSASSSVMVRSPRDSQRRETGRRPKPGGARLRRMVVGAAQAGTGEAQQWKTTIFFSVQCTSSRHIVDNILSMLKYLSSRPPGRQLTG